MENWEVVVNDEQGVHSPELHPDLESARDFASKRSFFRRDAYMLVRRVGCEVWFESYSCGKLNDSNEGHREYPVG